MIEYFKYSRCRLKDYPGYVCYMLNLEMEESPERTLKCVQNGLARMNWWTPYTDYVSEPEYILGPEVKSDSKNSWTYEIRPKGVVPDVGSKLFVSPKCRIPVSLLGRYKVVTSVNDELPEYVVLPGVIKPNALLSNARLFVNDESKVVIALGLPDYDNYIGVLPKDSASYMPSLIDCCEFMIPEIRRFRPVEHEEMLTIYSQKDDETYLYLNGLLPKDRIVSEYDLHIGEEDLPYDIFKSCMLMMGSDDVEMRKAAYFTLARYDCRRYHEILAWAFSWYDDVFKAKQINKPFNWLHRLATEENTKHRVWKFKNPTSNTIAKKLIGEITDNQVQWDGSGNIITSDDFRWPRGLRWSDLAVRAGRY